MSDLSKTILAIKSHHRRRCFAMEQRKRCDLSLGSFLRLVSGWSHSLPAAQRGEINDNVASLIDSGEAELKAILLEESYSCPISHYQEWREVILASLRSRLPFDAVEENAEREMARLAKALPVWEWASGVRGFGPVSLAVIVGEAGELSKYPTKGHLWKRMGVAVVDGVRQGGLKKTASKEAWIEHGYNRERRSKMWVIGDTLIKVNRDGPYRTCYLARKAYERERAEARGLTVAPTAKIPQGQEEKYISEGHIHRRAQRYMEKRLLRDLWQAWKSCGGQGFGAEGHNQVAAA